MSMVLLAKMSPKSVFQSAFFINKTKRSDILDLSMTRIGLSFEILKLKIETFFLGEYGYTHDWSSHMGP